MTYIAQETLRNTAARAGQDIYTLSYFAASSTLLWRFYQGAPSLIGLAWLITFLFYPSLYLLRMGQMGLVVLFGLVCFLCLQEKGKHWQSGMVVLLPAVKPHLVYLFWIALALWIFQERRWKLLGGILTALLVATVIPMVFNPHLIAQSSSVWSQAQTPLFEYDTPTLGTILRKAFGWEKHWLQFLPMGVGTLGLLWHWRNRRQAWDWRRELPLLLAVSVWTCLYSWVSDLVLLLPVVIQTLVLILRQPSARKQIGVISLLGISVFCLAINLLGATDFAYFWLCPVLLVFYWT